MTTKRATATRSGGRPARIAETQLSLIAKGPALEAGSVDPFAVPGRISASRARPCWCRGCGRRLMPGAARTTLA
ncbi:MAG: hypothetical protein ACR2PL_25940 [Dehalococcoidia bacterium]